MDSAYTTSIDVKCESIIINSNTTMDLNTNSHKLTLKPKTLKVKINNKGCNNEFLSMSSYM